MMKKKNNTLLISKHKYAQKSRVGELIELKNECITKNNKINKLSKVFKTNWFGWMFLIIIKDWDWASEIEKKNR